MKNYKIKVNDEAESKEAQELFFELGAVWGRSKKTTFNSEPMSFIYFNVSTLYYGHDDENDEGWFKCKESGKELTLPQLRDLVTKSKNEQGLISGADAKLAWAKGDLIQIKPHDAWCDIQEHATSLNIFDTPFLEFRRKPRTITLSLEIPAPFEPNLGETYYFITTSNSQGFDFAEFDDSDGDKLYMQLGAYKTASDAQKAVAALRGGIKA